MTDKKKAAEKSKKDPAKKPEIKTGAIVMLTQSHGPLAGGEYEVEGFKDGGDVILKSDKGLVEVPLDKIEVIKKGTGKAPEYTKGGQQKFIKDDDKPFYIDPYGQMTINNIDTPLGKLAQRIIQAQLDIRRLEEQMTEDEDVMMKEMKTQKVTKITVLGHLRKPRPLLPS